MTRINYPISIALLGLTIILGSCGKKAKADVESIKVEVLPDDIVELREDQIKLAGIQTGTTEMRSLSNTLKVNGVVSVAPQSRATVCMPLGGFIKSTNLIPGNSVSKGQTLAVIENQDFVDIQQSYLETKNKLVYAEAEYKRHASLFKDEVYSEKNVEQVTVEYKNLKASMRSLEQKLLMLGIKAGSLTEDNITSTVNLVSPISGFLTTVNVNIGKYVSPTEVLFDIMSNNKLYLELTLFEQDADKVTSGQKIRFQINNESEDHEAVITQTGQSVSDDKTLKVYAVVNSTCKNILPGMYVNAYVAESENQVPALPSEAIVSFDEKDYIFVYEKEKVEDGKPFTEYRMIEVKKGLSGAGFTEVKVPEGLSLSNSRIVLKGAYNLLSAKKNAGEMAC